MHLACRLALALATAAAAGYAFYQTHKAGENSESFPIHEDDGLILTTPAKDEQKADIEIFPGDADQSQQSPGFTVPQYESDDEGFDIHSGDDMNLLYRKRSNNGTSEPRYVELPGDQKMFSDIRNAIRKGQAPKEVKNIHYGKLAGAESDDPYKYEMPHIHFEEGGISIDVSPKDGTPRISKKTAEWLREMGWRGLPK
jgi:hypothetical protein